MAEPLDDLTKRLMERARERREMLTKKMAETSPQRKRSSPLSNNQSQNIVTGTSRDQQPNDSPNKRYCVRQEEQDVHSDTPAIVGVKSRMANLMTKRKEWFTSDGAEDEEESAMEVAAPLAQPEFVETPNPTQKVDRKTRLAALASSVSSWEDDLTHVNLKQDLKPKKKWEPPKPEKVENDENTPPEKPPRIFDQEVKADGENTAKSLPNRDFNAKPRRFVSPARGPVEDAMSPPKCKETVVSSVTVTLGGGEKKPAPHGQLTSTASPKKAYQGSTTSPKKTFHSSISVAAKSPGKIVKQDYVQCRDNNDDQVKSPRKKAPRMSDVHEPTKKPVSARLASWKQKVDSLEEKAEPAIKPKVAMAGESAVKKNKLISDLQDDPLNMSIHSRMNVWELKIKETEEPSEAPVTPAQKAKVQIQAEAPKSSPSRHHSGSSLQNTSSRPNEVSKSKSGSNIAVSPGKVGCATKGIHEKLEALHQSWASNDIAEKTKMQKEADMEVLRNRWKSGILQETDERQRIDPRQMPDIVSQPGPVPPPPPPPAPMGPGFSKSPMKQKAAVTPKREEQRDKMRKEFPFGVANKLDTLPTQKNFESKLQMMGFEVEGESHTASVDLTPYKERDRARKIEAKVQQQRPGEGKPPLPPSGGSGGGKSGQQPVVQVEEKRVNTITFEEGEKVSVHRNKVTVPYSGDEASAPQGCSPVKTSRVVTTPKKGAGTPSIYSLVKRSGSSGPPSSPYGKTAQATQERTPQQPRFNRDSFSDDSFESPTSSEPSLPPRPVAAARQPSPMKQPSAAQPVARGSQLSLTSEYSETTDYSTQDDEYSDTEDVSDLSDENDESSQDGEVSDLLDEALSESESEDSEPPAPHTPVERRSRQTGTPQRVPRPISQPPQENRVSNTTDYYRQTGQRNSAPSQPDKRVKFASDYPSDYTSTQSSAHSSSESEREGRALAYSIDNYRQSRSKVTGPVPKMKIVRQPETPQRRPQEEPVQYKPTKPDKQRLQELQDRVNQEQSVIMQTSNALNQCCGQNMQFAGSQEAVECHKLLLIACKKREAYINEMHRIKQGQAEPRPANQGSLTISNIRLPLKQDFKKRIGGPEDTTVHYFLLLLRHKDHVVFSQMVSTHAEMVRDALDIPNLIKFSSIQQDFRVQLEVYGMSVIRELPSSQTPKKKKAGPFTPKKLLHKKGGGPLGHLQSPGGPGAVRSTNFVLVAHLQLHAGAQNRTHFMLDNVPFSSPLQGSVHLRMQCLIEINVEEKGFLTMFEDVSGLGAWRRRWFVLQNGFLSYWTYPDDERIKEPLGRMDLKQCITDTVGLIPRDVCARPNTFELITVRRQSRGEADSLVSRCHNTMTTTKHWLCADTKEERMLWCSRLNEALDCIRTWHSEALRPVKRTDMITPYNPYPSKADQHTGVQPFNPHDQESAC